MTENAPCYILTLNSGSSSLKFSVCRMAPAETRIVSGSIDRIGLHASRFFARDADGETLVDERLDLPDHEAALNALLKWLAGRIPEQGPDAVGHRIAHGGAQYSQPQIINEALLAALDSLVRLAPEHLPHALKVIRAIERHYPAMKQAACFDTAFHRHMPELAQRYPMPRSLWHEGVRRYGFHGLSYEYIVQKLAEDAGREAADGRLIVAHLGNGASMAAIHGAKSLDTTMGFTPVGGLMMGTRSGDLDPGVLLYLLEEKGRTVATVDNLVNRGAGLIGVSGSTSDMHDLLQKEADDPHAAQAVELFCYLAKKALGALAAVLGGLDTLVFTAGIGAHAPAVRRRICQGMDFLGIRLDGSRNEANALVVSRDDSPVTVRVMKTDEELMIARHTYHVLRGTMSGAPASSGGGAC